MKLDDVKKLHQKKYRIEFGRYLVEGEHLVLELQKSIKSSLAARQINLYITQQRQQWANTLAADFNVMVVNDKQMSKMSDTKTPQGVIASVPLPDLHTQHGRESSDDRYIFLHEVQDPGNLGTIIRNLVWFGGFRLLLSPNSVDPFNSKVVRASMGAIFHLPIEIDVEIQRLPQRFSKFAYLNLEGKKIQSPQFNQYECYLFGNEARGVPVDIVSEFNAEAFTIEGNAVIDSLNLANAVGICAYQLSIK